MIYLLEDRAYLKIGYTKDLTNRLKSYKLHNCYVKLLDFKDGNKLDEYFLHKKCKKYRYSGEWYNNCSEVKEIFSAHNDDWKPFIDHFISLINIRAQIIQTCWVNDHVSFEGLNLLAEVDKMLDKDFLKIMHSIMYGDKYNLYWNYYNKQNNIIKNKYSNEFINGKSYELANNIFITYGKE